MEKEKSQAEQLKEKLFMNRKSGTLKLSAEETAKADEFCEGYKMFLDNAKTERDAVKYSVKWQRKTASRNTTAQKPTRQATKFMSITETWL